jgi:hypothetical protein
MLGNREGPSDPGKAALAAELADAEHELARYEEVLRSLPRGSLVEKRIKGGIYYYLAYRVKDKVRFEYKGKLSPEERSRYAKARKTRAEYRGRAVSLRARISSIIRALGGRADNRPRHSQGQRSWPSVAFGNAHIPRRGVKAVPRSENDGHRDQNIAPRNANARELDRHLL